MKVLLSWTGKDREPRTFRGGEVVPGAHLQLLGASPYAGTFDRHFLFTVPQTLPDAEALVAEIAVLPGAVPTEICMVQLADPTDLSQIMYALQGALLALDEDHKLLGHELAVLLNAGTPQMQAAWLLLQSHGLLHCRILQTSPPDLARRSGSAAARETRLEVSAWKALFREVSARQGR